MSIEYTPDTDARFHEQGTIRNLCTPYRSHEKGLPEWLKNSADAYAREDATESKRVILVIFDYGRKTVKPSISCLDFCGMTSNMILDSFRHWADPDAALQGSKTTDVQGGHGNGGKCYMTQMFEDYSQLHTVKHGKGNVYGVKGGLVRFGFGNHSRDFSVTNLRQELEKMLFPLRCNLLGLPEEALKAIEMADGFTLVTGVGPRGYDNKIPVRHLVANLQEYSQMIKTLELCKVYVIVNGKRFDHGKQITLPNIPPMEGSEKPRVIAVPDKLKDPISEEEIATTNGNVFPPGTLTIRTSERSMRYSMKGRHNVIYKTRSGYIGYVGIPELDIQSPYRNHFYGECYLEALESFKQNERARLADSPLTRAVENFISGQIQAYAKEFEERDRRYHSQEEKNALSRMNEALDRWKNRFLDEIMRGMWGAGGPVTGDPPPEPPLQRGKPAKLELTLSHQKAGIGVSFQPTLKFFDSDGKRISKVPFRWVSEDNNIAMVDDELMRINTYSVGPTSIYAETLSGKISSNKVHLEVIRIHEIKILPEKIEIPSGSRHKFEAICRLANDEVTIDAYLIWNEDNPSVARVSSSGLVFGFEPGETKVTAGDDKCEAKEPAVVRVVPAKMRGQGDQRGLGFAKVLISEFDTDPDTGEIRSFSSEDPPICQEPRDYERKIWWINSAAPLARMYSDNSLDYGYNSREWRMYYLERYIDIIVQIVLTHGPTEKESMSVGEWILKWGEQVSEIQEAAASSLSEFIANGKLPED